MSIDAAAAISSAHSPATSFANAPFEVPNSTTARTDASQAADAFRAVLDNMHADLSRYASDPAIGDQMKADPVESVKQEIRPQANSEPASDGNTMLRKSFDHAIFVTLVSQVVSGLSQTTSTLLKQQ
jgi:hypothetical protein